MPHHPVNCLFTIQVGAIFYLAIQTILVFGNIADDIQLRCCTIGWLHRNRNAIQVQRWYFWRILHGEQYLEQWIAGHIPLGGGSFHYFFKGGFLVGISFQGGGFYLL